MINTKDFFRHIFKNAKENSVLILDKAGNILFVNTGFIKAFGYKRSDVTGRHFRMLFTEKDRQTRKPEKEVREALSKGSKSDNNYLVHKNGTQKWVMGESISVINTDKEQYIVKIIQDIHAQKQMEQFLLENKYFIDTIFDSIKDTALVILDSGLKITKINRRFTKMFDLKKSPETGTRLLHVNNPFWKTPEMRLTLTNLVVHHQLIKDQEFNFKSNKGDIKKININSKLIEDEGKTKTILLVIKEL